MKMRKLKALTAMVLAASMVLGTAGCGGSAAQEKTDAPQQTGEAADSQDKADEPLTVGLALSAINTNAIFIDMAKDIQARCDEAGYKLMTADIAEDPNKVVTALENFINGGCDVIIVQNYAEEACADLLKKAVEQGIIVGSYDYTSEYAQYAVIASNYDVGKAIGQACGEYVAANEGSKKVAICSYSSLDFLVERAKGMEEGFKEKCPDGEVVSTLDAGFASEGVAAGENFLQTAPDIQAVMGINDGGVLGVYEAFRAAGKSREKDGIALFGCDASEDGINALKEDDMFYCTIDLDLVNQVSLLYERCVEAYQTGKIDEANKLITYPMNPIYLENVDNLK